MAFDVFFQFAVVIQPELRNCRLKVMEETQDIYLATVIVLVLVNKVH